MNDLPWRERVVMLQLNPDAARTEDIVRMAEELVELWSHSDTTKYCTCGWNNKVGRIHDPGCVIHRTWK